VLTKTTNKQSQQANTKTSTMLASLIFAIGTLATSATTTTTAHGTCSWAGGAAYDLAPWALPQQKTGDLVVSMKGPPGDNTTVVTFNGYVEGIDFPSVPLSRWTKVNQGVDGWAYLGALQPGADTSISFSFFTPNDATFIAGYFEKFGTRIEYQKCTFAFNVDA
jgi:hypothetical protein